MASIAQPEVTDQVREIAPAEFVSYLLNHSPREEQRVLLEHVPWEQYEALHEQFGRSVRLSWLDGTLEVMAPISEEHESRSFHFGALIGRYCEEKGIRFQGIGSASLMDELKKAGKEPDESFRFHEASEGPDLAIEIALTSGGLNKLPIYARYEVPEVWIWRKNRLEIFLLKDGAYELAEKSAALPDLDLELLVECVQIPWSSDAVNAFLEGLRK